VGRGSATRSRRLRFEPLEDRRLLTITVDTLVDEDDGIAIGDISLRDAIAAAAANETIDFAAALTAAGPATITLTHGELLIKQAVQISGPLTAQITIDASGNDPTPALNNGDGSRIFVIDDLNALDSIVVSIRGLTLTGADFIDGGGAILNEESLTVSDSIISGNAAHWGGGIYNAEYGQLTVLRSQITGNSADTRNNDTGFGGGVDNWGGSATFLDCTISGNAAPRAGGLRNANFGSLDVDRSTISGNTAEITGGGIFTDSGDVTVRNSTISGNQATIGGGFYIFTAIQDSTKISNSTISGNVAPGGGGGIYNQEGTTIVEFSTITRNVSLDFNGSGVVSSPFPSTTRTEFHSSIIAGNFDPLQPPQAAPYDVAISGGTNSLVSLGYNIVGIGEFVSDTFNQSGDQILGAASPLLGPLADNGGPTKAHALLAGSPAIDVGDPNAVAGENGVPEFDQRGTAYVRVRDGDGDEAAVIDIGAFEAQFYVPGAALVGDYNLSGVVDAADFIVWRHTAGSDVAPYSGADGNGNGTIDDLDYDVWRASFGNTRPLAAGADVPVETVLAETSETIVVMALPKTELTRPAPAADRTVDATRNTSSVAAVLMATTPTIRFVRQDSELSTSDGSAAAYKDDALMAWIASKAAATPSDLDDPTIEVSTGQASKTDCAADATTIDTAFETHGWWSELRG
jgi:hypothetical protein